MQFMTRTLPGRTWAIATLLTLATACVGCGGGDGLGRVPVTGTVSYEKAPIATGNITFRPEDPAVQSETLDVKDGKFSGNLIPGKKIVEVRSYEVVTPNLPADSPEAGSSFKKQLLPAKFNDNSELTVEVDGKTPLTLDL